MEFYDVVIIGAGAAGMMCAGQAEKRGRKVLLLDHYKVAGEKIRISGGGRCNFTNLEVTPKNFLSQNPNFCISALKRFSVQDFLALIEKYQIAYHEKTLGQLFCDGSSKQIIDMLLSECSAGGVEIKLECEVNDISQTDISNVDIGNDISKSGNFKIVTNQGNFLAKSVVIASGGLSIPKIGASAFGYDIARKFGLNIITPQPALVPFLLDDKILSQTRALAGISLMAEAKNNSAKFREGILFTHKGLSGPAILQISSYWQEGAGVEVNLMPELEVFSWLQNEKINKPKQEIQTILAQILPKNLAAKIIEQAQIPTRLADISKEKLKLIAENINAWKFYPSGTEGFAKAEVTLGGVDTKEISSKTFEALKIPGLYFIGEVLDVTGHLGGYNFQWAWSSGYAAGQYV
jgi:predicted Rossmann fold flavoprotein